jgi:hypothetical protein
MEKRAEAMFCSQQKGLLARLCLQLGGAVLRLGVVAQVEFESKV